ncbi:hypothetical protein K5549_020606, partial [Capra hircus]
IKVYIPSFSYEESDLEWGYTVFKIEVLQRTLKSLLQYHKKCIKTPEIPSKHVWNWVPNVGTAMTRFETYLQAVILENEELLKLFPDFLNVQHLPSLPKTEDCGSFDKTDKLSHQPVLDPYVLLVASDFPNVVTEGVLHGIFYPHLQPS